MRPAFLVMLAFAAAPPDRPPVEFTSKEGGYSVTLPGKPKRTTRKVPLAGTEEKITVISQTVESSGCAYVVAVNDYPEGVLDATPQTLLKNVRIGNMGPTGRLLTESKGAFGKEKQPMRDITFTKEKLYFRNRIILVGDRLYQIMVVAGDEAGLTSPSANKMYESFALKPVK